MIFCYPLGINGYVWIRNIMVQIRKILLIGLILGFLGSCDEKQTEDYSKVNFAEASDSSLLEMARGGISNSDLRRFRLALLKRSEQLSSGPVIGAIIQELDKTANGDSYRIWSANTIRTSYYLEHGKADSALDLARKGLEFIGAHDSILASDVYHDLGMAHLQFSNNNDSVLFYWKKAYLEHEKRSDFGGITVTSFNLASYYHSLGFYELSRKYFARCIEVMEQLGKKSPMLMNNIISTLISREKYQEADRYWQENKTHLIGDTSTYMGQVILLNRSVLSHRLGRYRESDSLLSLFTLARIQPLLDFDYCQSLVLQAQRKKLDTLSNRSYENKIPLYALKLLYNNPQKFSDFITQENWMSIQDTIEAQYLRFKSQPGFDVRHLLGASRFLAVRYKGNPQKALGYFEHVLAHQDSVSSMLFHADQLNFSELNEYEKVMAALQINKTLLSASKSRESGYIIILALILVVAFLVFIAIRQKLIVSKERSNWLELQKEQAEALVLSNQRLLEYSKVVIERNNDIKRRLQGLDLKGRSAVVQDLKSIIKDLDVLNKVNTSEKPQVADRLIDDKKEQEHPHLKQLTKVEQRVYVLAQSDYRPKDIANMLGYSVQYVRNIKSRIRKKLDLDKHWGAD